MVRNQEAINCDELFSGDEASGCTIATVEGTRSQQDRRQGQPTSGPSHVFLRTLAFVCTCCGHYFPYPSAKEQKSLLRTGFEPCEVGPFNESSQGND